MCYIDQLLYSGDTIHFSLFQAICPLSTVVPNTTKNSTNILVKKKNANATHCYSIYVDNKNYYLKLISALHHYCMPINY